MRNQHPVRARYCAIHSMDCAMPPKRKKCKLTCPWTGVSSVLRRPTKRSGPAVPNSLPMETPYLDHIDAQAPTPLDVAALVFEHLPPVSRAHDGVAFRVPSHADHLDACAFEHTGVDQR